jgi:hypothetical protein
MTLLIIAVALIGALVGFCQGALKQLANMTGIIVGLVIAIMAYDRFGQMLADLTGAEESTADIIAFVAIAILLPLVLGWLATLLTKAFKIIHSMVSIKNPWVLFDGSLYECGLDQKDFWLTLFCIGILLFADFCKKRGIMIRKIVLQQDYWCRWLFISLAIVFLLVFGKYEPAYDASAFIYFQF